MDTQLYSEMVNLTRASDRKQNMTTELARSGVQTEMSPAVDCHTVITEEIYAHVKREGPWGFIHPPAAACTLSHMKIWERFLQTDRTHCLVLEDDIHISPELGQWTDDLSWWPEDAGIVKLECWRAKTLKILLDRVRASYLGRQLVRMYNRHVGSAGYILTRNAARALLAYHPAPLTVDNLLFSLNASPAARHFKVYQVQPALIIQGNEPPGWVKPTTAKYRPEGWMLVRQKLKRGYYELAYPLSTWAKFLTGRATLEPVTYAATVIDAAAPAHPISHSHHGADPAHPIK